MPPDVAWMWTRGLLGAAGVLLLALCLPMAARQWWRRAKRSRQTMAATATCASCSCCDEAGATQSSHQDTPQPGHQNARFQRLPEGGPLETHGLPHISRNGQLLGRRRVVCKCMALLLLALFALCIALVVTIWVYRPRIDPCQQVWARPLQRNGTYALGLVNFAESNATISCDAQCMARVLGHSGAAVLLRDIVLRRDVVGVARTVEANVPAHGSVLYLMTLES